MKHCKHCGAPLIKSKAKMLKEIFKMIGSKQSIYEKGSGIPSREQVLELWIWVRKVTKEKKK